MRRRFKVGDVFEFKNSPNGCWDEREGSIGIVVGHHSDNIYKVNWISDRYPAYKNRKEHPDCDNWASLDACILLTSAKEVTP